VKYEVFWTPSALNDLAGLWIDARSDTREAISAAAAAIDVLLADSPEQVGESRPNEQRIAFVSPLALRFQVKLAKRVHVIRVWAPEGMS
jgi:hypothetical protein